MPAGITPARNVRVPDAVWLPAKAKSAETGMPISEVVIEALADWAEVEVPEKNRGGRPPRDA